MVNKNKHDNNSKYRLKPYVSDDNVFQKIVEDRVDKIEKKNLMCTKTISIFCLILRKLNDDYSLDEIIDGLNKLNIVCIPLLKRSNNEINLL